MNLNFHGWRLMPGFVMEGHIYTNFHGSGIGIQAFEVPGRETIMCVLSFCLQAAHKSWKLPAHRLRQPANEQWYPWQSVDNKHFIKWNLDGYKLCSPSLELCFEYDEVREHFWDQRGSTGTCLDILPQWPGSGYLWSINRVVFVDSQQLYCCKYMLCL